MSNFLRALVVAAALAIGPSAALANQGSANQPDDSSELWGTEDKGEDKGRVQAEGSSYNVTHIAYAVVLMGAMGIFLIWLIRRHSGRKTPPRTDDDAM